MALQNTQLRKDFQQFLYHGSSMMVGRQAEMALRDARTLAEWRKLENQGLVRLRAEDEDENYFDVFGEPEGYTAAGGRVVTAEQAKKDLIETLDTYGNYWCVAEYLEREECQVDDCECPFHQDAKEEWEQADSIGMCAGYKDVLSPFENCYIIDLMRSAIEKAEGREITN